MDTLEQKIKECRQVFENEFWDENTHQIYDWRTSLNHADRFATMPTPEEIKACIPNACGWNCGVEDAMINAGIAMDMYLDAKDEKWARETFLGMKECGTISGVPGFVSRGVLPADHKSFYPESSRDQYTHYVYGLWRYWQSPFSTKAEKADCVRLLTDVAAFCEKYVTRERNWLMPRADFKPEISNVHKMWDVEPHEMARLPMFYAVAWNVTGDPHWKALYEKYARPAVEKSLCLRPMIYQVFPLLQMLNSLIPIYEIETREQDLRQMILDAMRQIIPYVHGAMMRAVQDSEVWDLHICPPDWRKAHSAVKVPPYHYIPKFGEAYAMGLRTLRDISEGMLVLLMMPEEIRQVTIADKRFFRSVLEKMEPARYMVYPIFYPAAAWYKAKSLGIDL